jgi:hypothetical protein
MLDGTDGLDSPLADLVSPPGESHLDRAHWLPFPDGARPMAHMEETSAFAAPVRARTGLSTMRHAGSAPHRKIAALVSRPLLSAVPGAI